MLGRCIEQYRIEALIGEGAHAGVYRAVHATLGSVHALKIPWLESDEARAALLREGRAQAAVRHPNLVGVTDVIGGDVPALVLEYVTGPTLETWLARSRAGVGLATRLQVFRSIVDGVQAIHRAGLVHGDLKPANVLLAPTPDGWQPKIIDFGGARLHLAGRNEDPAGIPSGGTGGYMAPEQVMGRPIDARADMFALGCVLYELITGRRAFTADDAIGQARATLAGLPAAALDTVPAELRAVVAGLLERDADRRTRSCEALVAQLPTFETLGALASTPLPPVPAPSPARPRPHRCALGPLQLAALGGAAAGTALGLVLVAVTGGDPGSAPSPAMPVSTAAERPVEVVATAVIAPAPPRVEPVVARSGTAPPPRPLPRAAAPARTARVRVEGDAVVTLIDAEGRAKTAGWVAPGTWRYRTHFGGVHGPEGAFSVGAGETVTVRCSSFAMRCNVITR